MDENAWLVDYWHRDPVCLRQDETGRYRDNLDELTAAQRTYLLVWVVQGEVNNGGFEQFLDNSSGDTAELVPDALWRIGAFATSALVARVLRTFSPDPIPTDQDARQELLSRRLTEIEAALREADRAFYAEPDDLTHLLYAFIQAHPADFGLNPE